MEQNNQLAKLNTEQFGDLVKLPDVLQQNVGLATRAAAACQEALERVKAIDFTKVDLQQMESHDAKLNELQVKLKDSYNVMMGRRSPYTKFFDEVKSLFTAEEKKVIGIGEEIKTFRDGWQKEKARRSQQEEQKRQEELKKKQEEIDMRAYCKKLLHENYATALYNVIGKLNDAFNAQTLESFAEYEPKLRNYTPVLDQATYNSMLPIMNARPQFYTREEMEVLYKEVAAAEFGKLQTEWVSRLTVDRDRLVELIPSRKRELERIATDKEAAKEAETRMQREAAEREAQMKQEATDRAAAAQESAEVEKMDAAFEQAAEATPVVGIAKGTQVKQKYVVKSHAAWVAIIQQWVTNDMSKCTLDELQKKFGFMRTAAEKRLNEGVTLEAKGLETEEDYSTRASRSTNKVA